MGLLETLDEMTNDDYAAKVEYEKDIIEYNRSIAMTFVRNFNNVISEAKTKNDEIEISKIDDKTFKIRCPMYKLAWEKNTQYNELQLLFDGFRGYSRRRLHKNPKLISDILANEVYKIVDSDKTEHPYRVDEINLFRSSRNRMYVSMIIKFT